MKQKAAYAFRVSTLLVPKFLEILGSVLRTPQHNYH